MGKVRRTSPVFSRIRKNITETFRAKIADMIMHFLTNTPTSVSICALLRFSFSLGKTFDTKASLSSVIFITKQLFHQVVLVNVVIAHQKSNLLVVGYVVLRQVLENLDFVANLPVNL